MCIPNHHLGYSSWETYLANRERLRNNWRPPKGEGGGAAREGRALLQGLVRCGRCGRKMAVGYSGNEGSSPRYLCALGLHLYGSTQKCQSIGGHKLDAVVVDEVFALLEPASIAATAAALSEAESHHARRMRAFELNVERARFEAERARRQFDVVEPENRLVARSLERDWEQRLHTRCAKPRPISRHNAPGVQQISPPTRRHGCHEPEQTCTPSSTRQARRHESASSCSACSSPRSSSPSTGSQGAPRDRSSGKGERPPTSQ